MLPMTMKDNYAKALDLILFATAMLAAAVLVVGLYNPEAIGNLMVVAGISFTVSLALLIYQRLNPDSVRARQSDATLRIASETLSCLQQGMDIESAQKVCHLLLPATGAQAVAITDKEHILGYAGLEEKGSPGGSVIRTKATYAALQDGRIRVLGTPEEIGFPSTVKQLKAGIIVPLRRGESIVGTLKFYYRRASQITETQLALAEGLGELLSTQLAAVDLDRQTKLATAMELKVLQSQINPHFLFNTINTIASLVRTDPERARMLLREFAVFYRRTLENSEDFIELARELDQTSRYFNFEVARFGDDRLALWIDVEDDLEGMMVPAFTVQPLVENAVRHAMPTEGKLTVRVTAECDGDDVILKVCDDGVGMDAEHSRKLLRSASESSEGMGIAMKNINDRIRGNFGAESRMDVQSQPGKGTCVIMHLKDALKDD